MSIRILISKRVGKFIFIFEALNIQLASTIILRITWLGEGGRKG